MIYQTLRLFTFLTSATAILGAPTGTPTPLDAATLLQNGEEAQALNRFFQGLNASDPCQDGQVACLAGKTIAKCQGTLWETTVDSCSQSQRCFALPSVSSSGTRLDCTSERSAESLIAATGATGGIFGNPSNSMIRVYNGYTTKDNSNELSTTQIVNANTNTNTPAYATPAAAGASDSQSDNSPPNNADGGDSVATTSHHPCTKAGATPSEATPTPIANQNAPPYTAPSVSAASEPDVTSVASQQVTVTVTLNPSQPTTLEPQTNIISPEDASSIVASIKAASQPTATPESPSYGSPRPAPTLAQAAADDTQSSSTSAAVIASPSPSPAAHGSGSSYY